MPYNAKQVARLQTLRDEPAYDGMDDATFHTAVNTKNLDDVADPLAILNYVMSTEFRGSLLYGRIGIVSSVLPDPITGDYGSVQLGTGPSLVALNRKHVSSARTFIRLTDAESGLAVPLTNTELGTMLDDLTPVGQGCEAMSGPQKTAIIALSQNQRTPAEVAGLPAPSLGDVQRTA